LTLSRVILPVDTADVAKNNIILSQRGSDPKVSEFQKPLIRFPLSQSPALSVSRSLSLPPPLSLPLSQRSAFSKRSAFSQSSASSQCSASSQSSALS